jgi:hypothetical protein
MSNKDLQISFLFATSDLVDVDDSGTPWDWLFLALDRVFGDGLSL